MCKNVSISHVFDTYYHCCWYISQTHIETDTYTHSIFFFFALLYSYVLLSSHRFGNLMLQTHRQISLLSMFIDKSCTINTWKTANLYADNIEMDYNLYALFFCLSVSRCRGEFRQLIPFYIVFLCNSVFIWLRQNTHVGCFKAALVNGVEHKATRHTKVEIISSIF